VIKSEQPSDLRSSASPVPSSSSPSTYDIDIEDSSVCIVCMAATINSVFIPCGHAACCLKCGNRYLKISDVAQCNYSHPCFRVHSEKIARCPICREGIENCQKLFIV